MQTPTEFPRRLPTERRRARRIRLVVLGILGAVWLVGAQPAAAHTELVSSSPADGAVLEIAPVQIVFTFDENLLPGTTSLSVFDDAGAVLASSTVEPQGASVSMPLPDSLPPGLLHAAYRVVSEDGHPVTGEISFTVQGSTASAAPSAKAEVPASPSAAAPSTPPADAQRSREEGRASANFSIALGVVLVALAIALYVKRRRQQQQR